MAKVLCVLGDGCFYPVHELNARGIGGVCRRKSGEWACEGLERSQ